MTDKDPQKDKPASDAPIANNPKYKPMSNTLPASSPKGDQGNKPQGGKVSIPSHIRKPPAPKLERLELPRGALIAFRKSGGIKFLSREIAIYPDGRASLSGTDLPKPTAKTLTAAQITEIRQMLSQAGFFGLMLAGGHQPPDSYAYEIIAQGDAKPNYVEVFDGGIPVSLVQLIKSLTILIS
jgi:hypothetical protein